MTIDLSTTIAGVRIDPLVMNASGPRSGSRTELLELARDAGGAIVTKSITLAPRSGNPLPRYANLSQGSALNAMGLPNLGVEAYCALLPELRAATTKPVIASVAGMDEDEYVQVAARLSQASVDLIELNLSCPNVAGHGVVGYDHYDVDTILSHVRRVVSCPVGVKLPPFIDKTALEWMVLALRDMKPAFITMTNTLGFALAIDPNRGTTRLAARDGYGGLSGAALHAVALANVHTAATLLEGTVPIIGVGGIQTGKKAYAFLLAGASAVQVGTARLAYSGHDALARITQELGDHVRKYSTSQTALDHVGKLQVAKPHDLEGLEYSQ